MTETTNEMPTNNLYALVWKLLAVLIFSVIVTLGSCEMFRDAKIAAMVSNGTDPMLARCAVSILNSGGDQILCDRARQQ